MASKPDPRSAAPGTCLATEFDREFRDFIGSIAVSEEELVAIVNMPDYSIPQVKEHLRKTELTDDVVRCPLSLGPRPRGARLVHQDSPRLRAPVRAGDTATRNPPGARTLRAVTSTRSAMPTTLPKG